jgi:hypothetical protein
VAGVASARVGTTGGGCRWIGVACCRLQLAWPCQCNCLAIANCSYYRQAQYISAAS